MNIEEILTAEAVKVILSGISWKQVDGKRSVAWCVGIGFALLLGR